MLTSRFSDAVRFAIEAHGDQVRKATDITYVAHLLAAAAYALDDGADEDTAIAALLHDVLEDTDTSYSDVEGEFGTRVADIVRSCSDTEDPHNKPPWKVRKQAYLDHLEALDADADADTLRVSLADKLHNAQSIVADLHQEGADVWLRFTEPSVTEQLWYYQSLSEILGRKRPGRNARALAAAVERLGGEVRDR